MLHTLPTLLAPAALRRFSLVANHVLGSEPSATERLRRHAGRCISLQFVGASRLLPALPPAVIQISPAGLLDIDVTGIETPDLRVSIDAGHPARMALALLAGERPAIDVQGDAALAADVSWLAEHLRWDVEADLERLFGPVPARELGRVGRAVLAGVRALVRSGQALAARA